MNRIVTIAATASVLIALSASTGKTSDKSPAATQAAYHAISESVLWSFGLIVDDQAVDDGVFPAAH